MSQGAEGKNCVSTRPESTLYPHGPCPLSLSYSVDRISQTKLYIRTGSKAGMRCPEGKAYLEISKGKKQESNQFIFFLSSLMSYRPAGLSDCRCRFCVPTTTMGRERDREIKGKIWRKIEISKIVEADRQKNERKQGWKEERKEDIFKSFYFNIFLTKTKKHCHLLYIHTNILKNTTKTVL